MIELPPGVVPNRVRPSLIDFGGVLRPSGGGATTRVDRLGNRWRLELGFPPHRSRELGRVAVARLARAKTKGLRVEVPLDELQGVPGRPVVDGAGQAGESLAVRALTPGYTAREGWWLSIERAGPNGGQHFLHQLARSVTAGTDGRAALLLTPMLRVPFADGAAVHLSRPMIEGLVDGDEWGWEHSVDQLLTFDATIEEAA